MAVEVDEQPVQGLISRVLGPQFVNQFILNVTENPDGSGKEYFTVWTTSDETTNQTIVHLDADNHIALAMGLNYYLKYYCHCSFTWNGDNCQITPSTLASALRKTKPVVSKYRYYLNAVTFGYTTVWWNWKRWEREIDWMALNGYNLPLAFVGQEYIWGKVYAQLGIPREEIINWFTGPAFLPWNRMGNLNGWGGNILEDWITSQKDLQEMIVDRMRLYGMKTVLPAFAGHVPPTLGDYFPEAKINQLDSWNNFTGTHYLDSSDPLFANITKLFIKEQTEVYGTDHFYNLDPFNEVFPPTDDEEYLTNTSAAIYNTLVEADPDAIWILQGWFFVRSNPLNFWRPPQVNAFLSGIPIGRLIVLDLAADLFAGWNKTNDFSGHNWIWCMLHNFGGRNMMYGKMSYIVNSVLASRSRSKTMIGIGVCPEGLGQNDILYDLMNEMSWRTTPIDLKWWTSAFVARRYGKMDPTLTVVWNDIVREIYTPMFRGSPPAVLVKRPRLYSSAGVYYDPNLIVRSMEKMLGVSDEDILKTDTFSYDLAQVTMQALSNMFNDATVWMSRAYVAKNLLGFNEMSKLMLDIITKIDEITSTHRNFLLGQWTNDARQWAVDKSQQDHYEFNARNLVTLWGPPTSTLHDYAGKILAGLTKDFYAMRWTHFLTKLGASLNFGEEFDDDTYQTEIQQLENDWNNGNIYYSADTVGNTWEVAAGIFKWMNTMSPLATMP
ncbi:hypothetical protein SAMD00019534_004390 [Acytostelium subglobosum LB1]|uniref:hypothetical protein n=1 Tax=Acytostelium subglobosum LB1 TaxID=1410327 RepID=UPI000644E6E9|nr:hypothetical protein SAMD00019534_004390 [Acytostelium subglobosum LB1]GAM17264.1 hypothetical protein SAMD00019534_004390 [Acytostelium subglobosum LB1]|eukprot:XP_012759326.1 hypothetical protein SAMD00019534_004390 [Acytostelium subglobosum LB1]